MVRLRGDILIERPPEAVFDFVADERNEPRFNPRMSGCQLVSGAPIGEGSRFRATLSAAGLSVPMTIEFTAFDRPRRLASHSSLPGAEIDGDLAFEPEASGTRIRWSWEVRTPGPARLVGPVVARMGQRQERCIWGNLKALLEGDARGTSARARRVRLLDRLAALGGADLKERTMPLAGDDLVPSPALAVTHAVTIDAPPDRVWPWLVQLGHGRAGFYSDSKFWDRCVDVYYRLLSRGLSADQRVGYRVVASDEIVAAWQKPKVGDVVADGPPGTAYYVVRYVEPDRAFVLFSDTHLRYLLPARLREDPRLGIQGEISASYRLLEREGGRTRLVRRMRMTCHPPLFRALAVPVVWAWGEAVTARRLLRGVKRRAEESAGGDHYPAAPTGRTTKSASAGMRRWAYRSGRPALPARMMNRGQALLHSAGIGPSRLATLQVRGRHTGRLISFPVVIADYQGGRYLVAMLGEKANWVRNLEAAGGYAVLRHGRGELVRLESVPVADRPPILRRYLQCAPGARAHFPVDHRAPVEEFEAIAPHTPVLRIRADDGTPGP